MKLQHVFLLLATLSIAFSQSPTSPPSNEPLFLSKYLPHSPGLARTLSRVDRTSLHHLRCVLRCVLISSARLSLRELFRLDHCRQALQQYDQFSVILLTTGNTYFWFLTAENSSSTAPVVVWLQGGPGASSLYGLFGEHGPFSVDADAKTLLSREYRWTKDFNMLYIGTLLPIDSGPH